MESKIESNFNKEIYLLRLAVTTECILRCRYCFIKKTNKVISYEIAEKSINLLLNSLGNQKLLIIYGGEPLLYFDLVKKIIVFAQKKAIKLKKSLIISLGTNGILLNQNQLKFFKETDTKLAISLDGQKKIHDKARVFPNSDGSFDDVFNKLPLILSNIEKKNLCILFGVLPSSAYKMYDNLIYLTELGFDSINIEPIQSRRFKWNQNEEKVFLINLNKICQYLYKNIFNNNFIFLNTINRELKNKRLSFRKNICPFFENLEVYPDGEMAFSPFLINSKYKSRYIIGDINKGLLDKYVYCNYSCDNDYCKNCWRDYLRENSDLGRSNNALRMRDFFSIYLSKKILNNSKKKSVFKKYIYEAKKRTFE